MSELSQANPGTLPPREVVHEGSEMIGRERWEELRRMHVEGRPLALIARQTGLDRKTVRRCLRQAEWRPYSRVPGTPTMLAAHMA